MKSGAKSKRNIHHVHGFVGTIKSLVLGVHISPTSAKHSMGQATETYCFTQFGVLRCQSTFQASRYRVTSYVIHIQSSVRPTKEG